MKTKKPDIFLGITMGMLVLAAVLCLTILFIQKSNSGKNPSPSNNPDISDSGSALDSNNPGDTAESTKPSNPLTPILRPTDPEDTSSAEPAAIDEKGLKDALDESLKGQTNDWQVVVMDPILGTRVDAFCNSPNTDDWMKADGMVPVFVMGAVFQQVADGTLTEDAVIEDVKSMIVKSDGDAADRLTSLLGGGSSSKGMDAVKKFASDNGLKLGYNRTMSGTGDKPNYVTALQMSSILNMICKGELVSKEASEEMLDILCTPKDSDMIDPGVSGEGVRYGFVSYAKDSVSAASMGVVRLPHRSYVVSVVCNSPAADAKDKIAEILALVGTYFAD